MDGQVGRAIVALGAYAGALGVWTLLSVLHGRTESILRIPLAVAFFWFLVVLIGMVMALIFGDEPEGWTRVGMLVVAILVVLFDVVLWRVDSAADMHGLGVAIGILQTTAAWVALGALFGAIFGKLPDIEMADGD